MSEERATRLEWFIIKWKEREKRRVGKFLPRTRWGIRCRSINTSQFILAADFFTDHHETFSGRALSDDSSENAEIEKRENDERSWEWKASSVIVVREKDVKPALLPNSPFTSFSSPSWRSRAGLLVLLGGDEQFGMKSVHFRREDVFADEAVFVDEAGHRFTHVRRPRRPRLTVHEHHLQRVNVVEPRHAYQRRGGRG